MTANLSTRGRSALGSLRCVIVGVGGLGHPVIAGLCALGVRDWVLIDPDLVEPSNLHRQWLFLGADRHREKAQVAAEWIRHRAPDARVQSIAAPFSPNKPLPWSKEPDRPEFWFECSDQPALKFALSQQALARRIPCVIGGVLGWQGQVFWQAPQRGCYHCLFEAPPPSDACASCETAGVLTTAAAAIGTLMVAQAERLAQELERKQPSPNGLLHFNLLNHRRQELQAPSKRDCCHCGHLASGAGIG